MKIDHTTLDAALGLLGEILVSRDRPAQHFVVCGGSSLLALGLVRRTTTRDVDILARMEEGELVTAKPLPDWLHEDARDVGVELSLPEGWFNTGPSDDSFFRFGLPEGLAGRVTTREYGPRLWISFISRYDQIHLKLYATADQDAGRHFQDLQDLKPTADELLAAARWTRNHDPSEGFLQVLGKVLEALNYGNLVHQLQ
jgi:hypothetical protein